MHSLALIGKDEAQGLKDLLSDVQKYFDEVILVSTDHNQELIKTAKELGCQVYDEYFGKSGVDFDTAKARNFSFDKCSGEIIAWFDLDDRVPNGQVIPLIFEAMAKADWVYCNYNYAFDADGNVLNTHLKPRFMKKGTGHWEKSVHEDFVAEQNVIQVKDSDFLVEPLIINHQHTITDLTNIVKKAERNLGLLMKEYKEDGEKTDLRTIQYIGTTLISLGRYEEAVKFLLHHYKFSGSKEDKYWSLKRAAFCLRMVGENDGAINLLLEATKLYPEWSTAYLDLGEIYSTLQDWDKTIEWTLTGMNKKYPDTVQMLQPLDYTLHPLGRLAEAYLYTNKFQEALEIAKKLKRMFPKNRLVNELLRTCEKADKVEGFVQSFIEVATAIRQEDRLKAVQLFEVLPNSMDDDIRIQTLRFNLTPPKQWEDNSIVIYCGRGIGEHWAYPSLFTGIGGSETAVIFMSQELTKLGYKVTVFNSCGDLRGEYNGVTYKPYYHFNPQDSYNILIGWRTPLLFAHELKAKKKYIWLHDIAHPTQFSEEAIKNTDKFIFLSKWHRNNMPSIPEEKIFISNNGIDPKQYEEKLAKRPNSLVWTASYDRGLLPFMKNIFPLIKAEIPEVTLDVAYGWQNIDKELDLIPELRQLREELTPLLEKEGITHHGRLSHKKVNELYKTSMVYAYASEFGETNCISSQQAQAAGCYVLTTQQAGAVPEYLRFGEAIPHNNIYSDKRVQREYAKRVVEYLRHPKEPVGGIVEAFSWEQTAKSWKELL